MMEWLSSHVGLYLLQIMFVLVGVYGERIFSRMQVAIANLPPTRFSMACIVVSCICLTYIQCKLT